MGILHGWHAGGYARFNVTFVVNKSKSDAVGGISEHDSPVEMGQIGLRDGSVGAGGQTECGGRGK